MASNTPTSMAAVRASFTRSPVWDEWGRVTRFIRSAEIALRSETDRFRGVSAQDHEAELGRYRRDGRKYSVKATEHLAALADEHLLFSMLLHYSFGLVEGHAREVARTLHAAGHLSIHVKKDKTLEQTLDEFTKQQVEAWTHALFDAMKRPWPKGLKADLVEASIVGNAVAHGLPTVTQTMHNRASQAGATLSWGRGAEIVLTRDRTEHYRGALKKLGGELTAGVVATMKTAPAQPAKPQRRPAKPRERR